MDRAHTFMVPAYKESPFLSDCLKSLKAQTIKSDIVVTTATPSAHIERVAAAFDVPVMINDAPPSIASDWQFAIDHCKTPCFTLAHQDDLYYPAYAETLLSRMDRAVIAFCDYEELVGETLRHNTAMLNIKRALLWPFLLTRHLSRPGTKRLVLKFGSAVCCPSVMYNRKRMGDFRFDPAYEVDLDWDAWLRLSEADGSFSYINSVLMAHRIHADSETTRQIHNLRRRAEDEKMFLRQWPQPVAKALNQLYARSTDSNRAGENADGGGER